MEDFLSLQKQKDTFAIYSVIIDRKILWCRTSFYISYTSLSLPNTISIRHQGRINGKKNVNHYGIR